MKKINEIKRLCEKHEIAITANDYYGNLEVVIRDTSKSIDPFDYGDKLFVSDLFCPEGSIGRRFPKVP